MLARPCSHVSPAVEIVRCLLFRLTLGVAWPRNQRNPGTIVGTPKRNFGREKLRGWEELHLDHHPTRQRRRQAGRRAGFAGVQVGAKIMYIGSDEGDVPYVR